MDVFNGISPERLEEILSGIKQVNVVLIGDICLDVYWKADMTKSELSRETPHYPLPIVEERMSPGAGGNVAANIAALNPASVRALGVIGKDWRGDAVIRKLKEAGIDTEGIVTSKSRVTNAYCKPVRKGTSSLEYEDPRLDFSNYGSLSKEDEGSLLEFLGHSAGGADILCVSDQFAFGCITPAIREKIISLAKEGLRVIVDSRDRIGLYSHVILKPNEMEGTKAVYGEMWQERLRQPESTIEDNAFIAKILAERNQSDVCMTLGPKGCVYNSFELKSATYILSYEVVPPIDICGAGDTFLSAFSCALASGAKPMEATSLANMTADVTIKKTGMTGTASPEEIRVRHYQILCRGGTEDFDERAPVR